MNRSIFNTKDKTSSPYTPNFVIPEFVEGFDSIHFIRTPSVTQFDVKDSALISTHDPMF